MNIVFGGRPELCVEGVDFTDGYWLVQHSDGIVNTSAARLKFNSKVFLFSPDHNGFLLTEIYKLGSGVETLVFGLWDPESGLSVDRKPIWWRRRNLKRFQFRVSAVVNDPYITDFSLNCTSSECFRGMFADIWHILQETLNFTYIIKEATEPGYGTFVNGTWKGQIGTYV